MRLAPVDVRSLVVVALIIYFGLSYSSALYVAANVLFLDMNKMNTWRDFTFISYFAGICFMALTAWSNLEKELVKIGMFYGISIFTGKILGYNFDMPKVQYQLILISIVTIAFILIVIKNAKKHGINGKH